MEPEEESDVAWRICTRIEDAPYIPAVSNDSASDYCSRCHEVVWVATEQKIPEFITSSLLICTQCAMDDPTIGRPLLENLIPAMKAYFLRGETLVFRSDEEESTS